MKNQELFDKYILGQLSDEERYEVEEKLKNDEDFANEFRLYNDIAKGVRTEAEQDCSDFGNAMKHITKAELQNIISPNRSKSMLFFPRWIWWPVSSVAVLLLVAVSMIKINNNTIDNILYSYNEPMLINRGGDMIDMEIETKDSLEKLIPYLIDNYQESTTPQEVLVNGKNLSMVYIKLHQRRNARMILQELIDRYEDNEDYKDAVIDCRKILNQITK